MLSSNEHKRYNRQIILSEIGLEGQVRIKEARVLLIGMGGLGCPIAQYLAAAGVGTLGIVDFDKVDLSNLQRQILYSEADLGTYKVEAAAKKINILNPSCNVNIYKEKCSPDNILNIIRDYDIVADCTDNYTTRYLINDACVTLDKPFVSASVFRFESQLSVYNYQNGPTYRCLFPEPPEEDLNCAEAGVIGVLVGIAGTMQANEIVKIITGAGEVLSGKLLLYNSLYNQFNIIKIRRDNDQVKMVKDLNGDFSKVDYEVLCSSPIFTDIIDISAEALYKMISEGEDIQLIDVREEYEHEQFDIGGELISADDIESRVEELSTDKPVVLYCSIGNRSAKAITALRKIKPFKNILHLKGGLVNWKY